MKIFHLNELNQNIMLYSLFVIIIGSSILCALLTLLKNLVDKKVDEEVEKFIKKARIPKVLKDRIGVNIKWR